MMTYEQAVATAFLQALRGMARAQRYHSYWGTLAEATYALRRLRVRAGLTP